MRIRLPKEEHEFSNMFSEFEMNVMRTLVKAFIDAVVRDDFDKYGELNTSEIYKRINRTKDNPSKGEKAQITRALQKMCDYEPETMIIEHPMIWNSEIVFNNGEYFTYTYFKDNKWDADFNKYVKDQIKFDDYMEANY